MPFVVLYKVKIEPGLLTKDTKVEMLSSAPGRLPWLPETRLRSHEAAWRESSKKRIFVGKVLT